MLLWATLLASWLANMILLTSQFCWNRRNKNGDRTGPAGAFSGFSGMSCTNACLRACWPKFSLGNPVCCLPGKMVETVPVLPLFPLNNIEVLSGVCSGQQTLLHVVLALIDSWLLLSLGSIEYTCWCQELITIFNRDLHPQKAGVWYVIR